MDGLPGLEAIFQRFFPRAQTQRCQKHAKANACRRVRKQERERFSKDLNAIFYAPTQSAARAAFFTLKQQWGRLFPSAVQIIEKDLDSLLTFFQFDPTSFSASFPERRRSVARSMPRFVQSLDRIGGTQHRPVRSFSSLTPSTAQ